MSTAAGIAVRIAVAESRAEQSRCQALIASVYHREYGVVFSDVDCDPVAKIERWPHRYLMGMIADKLAFVAGLYVDSTYVERFGLITRDDLQRARAAAGLATTATRPRREITKLVIAPDHRGRHLSTLMVAAAHSRAFLAADGDPPDVLLCSKRSLVHAMHHRAGIRPRELRPFPSYKVHERYATPGDPMSSYLILPELDIPAALYERALPAIHVHAMAAPTQSVNGASR